MKRYIILAIYIFISVSGFCQPASHVILVTIDGLRAEFYLNDAWPSPNLKHLMKTGTYAESVTGVFPTVTYPNHTTIITGALPSKHGIYCNEPFEPGGITGTWFWYVDSIKVPTLFNAVHNKGLTSAAVLWPVQVGSVIDYNVPDIWNPKTYDRVESIKQYIHPTSLWQEIETNATGVLTTDDLNEDRFSLDENTTRITGYLIRKYKPNFIALHLICTDDQQHEHGRDDDSVKLAVASADHCIGQLMEAINRTGIGDSTVIIVTGDHGFADIHSTIFPNVWLSQHGFISGQTWKAKFHSGRGSGFLRLHDSNDMATLNSVRNMLNALPEKERKLFTILEKNELEKLGAYPDASLAIVPVDGYMIGASDKGTDIRPSGPKGMHGYLPSNPEMKTGFIVSGAGINKGIVIQQMNLTDIAPLIAAILGLEFHAPDGKLISGILK